MRIASPPQHSGGNRALLFVPGDRPDRIGRAIASDADAVVVDLEDAVAAPAKARARDATVAAVRATPPRAALFLRINAPGAPGAGSPDIDRSRRPPPCRRRGGACDRVRGAHRFTLLTQNTAPLHVDHEYAKRTEFGQPLVNSTFTLSLVAGQSVSDVSQNIFANLGCGEITLPSPVFEGDTIRSRSAVEAVRESKSRPGLGVVTVRTTGLKQTGEVVIEFTRTLLVHKRGHGPRAEGS